MIFMRYSFPFYSTNFIDERRTKIIFYFILMVSRAATARQSPFMRIENKNIRFAAIRALAFGG